MRILQSMLTALVSAPTRIGALSWLQDKGIDNTPEDLVDAVLSATGEVSSLVYAARLLDRIEGMDEAQLEALDAWELSPAVLDNAVAGEHLARNGTAHPESIADRRASLLSAKDTEKAALAKANDPDFYCAHDISPMAVIR